ncbi:MAG TPA: hypothetical protein VFH08_01590 [Chitinophagaceae bacterium]|nr:hypothetical protein [Chitinophagaceae bacterium]
MLLSILNVRVIVNNKEIYPLSNTEPVIIEVQDSHPRIVVTDGFHFTRPIDLTYKQPSYYHFKVVCSIDDLQLLGNAFVLIVFYLLGFFTDSFVLKLLSFLPILYLLFAYYIDRDSFIQIKQDKLLPSDKRKN